MDRTWGGRNRRCPSSNWVRARPRELLTWSHKALPFSYRSRRFNTRRAKRCGENGTRARSRTCLYLAGPTPRCQRRGDVHTPLLIDSIYTCGLAHPQRLSRHRAPTHGGRGYRAGPRAPLSTHAATMSTRERLEPGMSGAAPATDADASSGGVDGPADSQSRRRLTSRNATCGKCVEARVRDASRPALSIGWLNGSNSRSRQPYSP